MAADTSETPSPSFAAQLAAHTDVANVVCDHGVDRVPDVGYCFACAGNHGGVSTTETHLPLLVRHSHDDAPVLRVAGRSASKERFGSPRAVLSRLRVAAAAILVASIFVVASPAAAETHEVASGDSLWTIAAAYGVTVDELIDANDLSNPDALRIGDVLVLPEPPYEGATIDHIVQPGEVLGVIAELYGVSSDQILRLNGLSDANLIRVASVLKIPDESAAEEIGEDYMVVNEPYTVQPGDSLSVIAERFDVEVGEIMRATGLASANIIQVDQVLQIPTLVVIDPVLRMAMRFEAAAEENSLDPNLLKALGWQESRWQADAVSYAGAVGVTQIMPYTADFIRAELLGDDTLEREDADDNIAMGAAYLAYLFELSEGNVDLALASYYQGFTSVTNNGMRTDTQRYVASILAYVPRFESGELPA